MANQPPPFQPPRDNPYAAPTAMHGLPLAEAAYGMPPQATQWVGYELHAPEICVLPPKCVYCNDDVDQATYKSRALYYQSPWLFLLLLLNILIFAIVSLIVRKKCLLSFGFCAEHRRKRRNKLLFCFIGLFVGIGSLVLNAMSKNLVGSSHRIGRSQLFSIPYRARFRIAIVGCKELVERIFRDQRVWKAVR